jgi:transposase
MGSSCAVVSTEPKLNSYLFLGKANIGTTITAIGAKMYKNNFAQVLSGPSSKFFAQLDFCGILSLKGDPMPGKRFVIQLTPDEQHTLETYVRHGQRNAREINRARILLLSHEGRKVRDIAQVLGVSQATVSQIRKKFAQQAHDQILDLLKDEPRSGRPVTFDTAVEAKASMIACSTPPEGRARWTLHLIADQLVKLDVTERISHESVRSLLKKTNSSHG